MNIYYREEKKTMKAKYTLIITLILLVLTLGACGEATATVVPVTTAANTAPVTAPVTTTTLPVTTVATTKPVTTGAVTTTVATTSASNTAQLSPADAKKIIESKATEIILALKNKDLGKVATYVNPQKGLRFSPYSFVSNDDLVFTADKVNALNTDKTVYNWGVFDGSGNPIELTFSDYNKQFVYSHDFANATDKGYNEIIGRSNTTENSAIYYPGSIVVEYHLPGFDPKVMGMDWKSLRLVFQPQQSNWYLVGIIHDEWTI